MGTLRHAMMVSIVLIVLMAACARDTAVAPAIDTVPPGPPVGLGVASEGGDVVRISWSQNAEPDLAGYKVYRASIEDGLFGPVSPRTVVCPWYYEHVSPMDLACFKVTAVDENGNESAFSQAVGIYLNDGWRNPPLQPQDPR
jgi:hypothetical protein